MTRSFLTALTFFISSQVLEISDSMEEDGLLRIVFRTIDDGFGCVVEMEDGYFEIEIRGEVLYRIEPELMTICEMDLARQGATILRIINAGRRDGLFSFRSDKFLQIVEETVEAFAYSNEKGDLSEDRYIFPVLIDDMITPLHLN